MDRWEYKIKEFTTWHRVGITKDGKPGEMITFEDFKQKEVQGIFGTKTKTKRIDLTAESIESVFNDLGKQGWELCEVVPLTITSSIGSGSNTDRVYFIFKRQLKD